MSLVNDISHIITCLYRLFIAIRNPVPPDRLRKLASIDVSHLESRDIKHISEHFPRVPGYLLERLKKANTKRRQLLRYYQLHHDKLARFVDLPPQDNLGPPTTHQIVNHDELSDAYPVPPEGPCTELKPRTTLSTVIPNEMRPEIHDRRSADAGHDGSPTSTQQTTIHAHVPPPPNFNAAYSGQPFECPYCFTLITLDNMRSWK